MVGGSLADVHDGATKRTVISQRDVFWDSDNQQITLGCVTKGVAENWDPDLACKHCHCPRHPVFLRLLTVLT